MIYPHAAVTSGMAICPMRVLAYVTAIGCTARGTPSRGTGLTRRSCCWTHAASAPRVNRMTAPKSVVVDLTYDWQDDTAPRTAWGKTVLYEAHVKGLTYRHPGLPEPIRGTYKALGHPVMIAYLKRLGITALELMPVAHFGNEQRCRRVTPARLSMRWMSFAMR